MFFKFLSGCRGLPIALSLVLASVCCFGGCEDTPTTGGDVPVTSERLSGRRLTDIQSDLSWAFDETNVIIENKVNDKRQPIPPELIEDLLGNQSTPAVIDASWKFDEKAGLIRLFNVKADGESIDRELSISINPAGAVRVNLGSRQYNMFLSASKDK